ncbi:hypothetical protein V5O48_006532 [Marasmius crinis-equi]|uniref:Uncharacterized protein n=1 Tax=Marasmius crinis-equi TaxID=585013 RepID=A0ABR3FJ82_9AGAR
MSSSNTPSVETVSDNAFDPFSDELSLHRCVSPTSSIRGCYVRSRPTSIIDDSSGMQNQLLNFAALAEALEEKGKCSASPPPYSYSPRRRGTRRSHSRYEVDTVSVITTRTTVSTFRPVRNPDASPPMLRQSEKGRKFSRSTADLLGGSELRNTFALEALKEQKEGKEEKGWKMKGGRRLKERFSLLFSGRKENAGILDRDETELGKGHKRKGHNLSFSAFLTSKHVDSAAQSQKEHENAEVIPLEHVRSRKTSVFGRRGSKKVRVNGVRHSKSFSGFRGSAGDRDVDIPPVPELPVPRPDAVVEEPEVCDEDDIDEITREAAQVNEYVRRTYSYEEEVQDDDE